MAPDSTVILGSAEWDGPLLLKHRLLWLALSPPHTLTPPPTHTHTHTYTHTWPALTPLKRSEDSGHKKGLETTESTKFRSCNLVYKNWAARLGWGGCGMQLKKKLATWLAFDVLDCPQVFSVFIFMGLPNHPPTLSLPPVVVLSHLIVRSCWLFFFCLFFFFLLLVFGTDKKFYSPLFSDLECWSGHWVLGVVVI